MRPLIVLWLLVLTCSVASAEEYRAEKRRVDRDADGAERVYLVQELAPGSGAASGLFVLMSELRDRYGKLPVVLAGASAGGRRVYEELQRWPADYRGVILLCPAVALGDDEPVGLSESRMPFWIESGENDRRITATARSMARYLSARRTPYRYIEIPDGNHDAPVKQAHWQAAFEFVTGNRR